MEECSVFEYWHVLHDTSLDADGLSRGYYTPRSSSSHGALASALCDLTNLPLGVGNGPGLKQISKLILLGESVGDRRLHEVLKEILGERSDNLVTTISDGRARTIDPLFAASRGLAQDRWDRMDF